MDPENGGTAKASLFIGERGLNFLRSPVSDASHDWSGCHSTLSSSKGEKDALGVQYHLGVRVNVTHLENVYARSIKRVRNEIAPWLFDH